LEENAKLALIVEYDGTRYHGSQWQANSPTIQEEIEDALRKLTGETIRIMSASRTDAGVHAKGQVVSFRTMSTFSSQTWVKALNFYLPMDIAVRVAYKVRHDFNVRRDALSREYHYYILNRFTRSPLMQKFVHFVSKPLDIDGMNHACQILIGEHDFAPFSSPTRKRTIRTVYKAEVDKKGDLVIFDMVADSFLFHQVRNTIGGLIKVGLDKIKPDTFWELASSSQSGVVGPVAPAHGLCLVKINYTDFPPHFEEEARR
jgi:tRNA pseudouridine38-40 synthase